MTRETQDIVEEFIILACKGDHNRLNEIFKRIVLDYDVESQGIILSGLAGAIHEFNMQLQLGKIKN